MALMVIGRASTPNIPMPPKRIRAPPVAHSSCFSPSTSSSLLAAAFALAATSPALGLLRQGGHRRRQRGAGRLAGQSSRSFAEYANWLLPERVLVGRYPYVEPFGWCGGEKQAKQQLEEILDAGITTFVCLQAELPAQDDASAWPAEGVAAPKPYQGVFLPYAPAVMAAAAARGHDRILFHHEPMVDGEAPPEAQMARLVAELEGRLSRGERIYLHCWGGQGRAGVAASCLLATLEALPAWAAMQSVQDAYRTRFNSLNSPQTAAQRSFVKEFLAPSPARRQSQACILCTGGAGYIGSHTLLALRQAGHRVVALDNLSRASAEAVRRVRGLLGEDGDADALPLLRVDLRDKAALDRVFEEYPIGAVIHFAAFKAVNESVKDPLLYYDNNVVGFASLISSMREHGVKTLVFSSSCTVYAPRGETFSEDSALGPTNPYGHSKLQVEQILKDVSRAEPGWSCCALRYFNPAGAHWSGELGEAPSGVVTNLVPLAQQVASGLREELAVYGTDYDTKDGTPVRDYVHVEDIAEGHVAALRWLCSEEGRGVPFSVFNLGTGCGSSVLEVVRAFEAASGAPLRHRLAGRRAGDAPAAVADPRKAEKTLGWKASRGLRDIVESAWFFQKCNPNGYADGDSSSGAQHELPFPDDLLSAPPGQLRALSKELRAGLVKGALRTQVRVPKDGEAAGAPPAQVAYGVDLGGSTLRVVRAEIKASGSPKHGFVITERHETPVPAALKSSHASADELFDFIADAVAELASPDRGGIEPASLVLGFAFSFPMDHLAPDRAVLRSWCKGWATSGVLGEDVGLLLARALRHRGLGVRALAVVNDCVGTLLAAPAAQLSVVIGTGTNACFVDPSTREVMNTEWGGFHPWQHRESTMLQLGDTTLEDLMACRSLPCTARALVAAGEEEGGEARRRAAAGAPPPRLGCMREVLGLLQEGSAASKGERAPALRDACEKVVERSAALCAAGVAALLPATLRPPVGHRVRVAMDGALIHAHPAFLAAVEKHLSALMCPGAASRIELVPVKDAASIGAMIAALGRLQ